MRQLLPWRTEKVTSLASLLHVSERQLRRRCRAAVGLTPKALQVLRRDGFGSLDLRADEHTERAAL